MAMITNPTPKDIKESKLRATEWRQFRQKHLITQLKLAERLHICRRTVTAIERGEVILPRFDTLIKFRDLKEKLERGEPAWR